MTRYGIDAPTLLHLVDNDLRPHATHQIVAPNLIRSESLDLLYRDVLAGHRDERAALRTLERTSELKMRLLGDRVSRATAWRIARERGWETTSEAEYFAVTQLQADAFVSVDRAAAERAAAVVPVAPLEALFRQDPAS